MKINKEQSAACFQNYSYPTGFDASLALNEMVPLIQQAYVSYYEFTYGPNVNNWPQFAQQEYGPYAPFHMPVGYTLWAMITGDESSIKKNAVSANNVPFGFWAVYGNGQYVVLVFRGTEGTYEWIEDGLMFQVPCAIQNTGGLPAGCVHAGFQIVYESLRAEGETLLKKNPAQGSTASSFYITGHSLGAALATMAALDFSSFSPTVYTLGCPRVGSLTFAGTMNQRIPNNYRITQGWDFIPGMPPIMVDPFNLGQFVYEHTNSECPVYSSALDFILALEQNPPDVFYGHHVSTYALGLSNLVGKTGKSE